MAIFYIFIYLIRIDNYITLYHIAQSKYSREFDTCKRKKVPRSQ